MRLLHTSDWHLGASDGDRILVDDQKHFIDEICEIVQRENVDAVMIAGDVYDRALASADAIKLYDYAMNKLCLSLDKEVIVIAGNHDSAERLAGCKDLLQSSGLYVLGALEREPKIINFSDTDVYLLPWFTEEKIKGLFPEKREDITNLTEAYRVVCDACRATFTPGKRHIAVSHAFITNAVASGSDKSAEIAAVGTALQVDSDVFDGFDYVALGHIHGPQNLSDTVKYSGTPMAYSFGREETQEKSVTIIDTDDMSKTVVPLHPLHKRTTLEGTFAELMNGEYPEDVKSGYVRLKVTDEYVGLEGISQLRSVYPNALEIQGKSFEGENVGIRMTMEEFQQLESNPMEIFRSFCKDVINEEPDEHLTQLFSRCLESEE